jgi:hypothetical protein
MGISTTQVNDFQRLLGRELVSVSVPNFRDFSSCFYGKFKDESEILPHLPHKSIGVFLG